MRTIPLEQANLPFNTADRLLKRVRITEAGCWEWTGYTNRAGYGEMSSKWGKTSSHRMSYATFNGDIPDGMYVCHKCDNPPCINPNHLFLGTAQDNVRDSFQKNRDNKKGKVLSAEHKQKIAANHRSVLSEKGRQRIVDFHKGRPKTEVAKERMRQSKLAIRERYLGSANPTSKLKNEDVLTIRGRHANGETMAQLARDYKIGETTVSRIVKRKVWTHI